MESYTAPRCVPLGLGARLSLKAACEVRGVTCHCSILPEDGINSMLVPQQLAA